MTKRKTETINIVLTEDQMATIRRELGTEITEWEVDFAVDSSKVGHPGALPDRPRGRAVFLTDEQRAVVKKETGRDCDYIQIETHPLLKYGGPPPTDR